METPTFSPEQEFCIQRLRDEAAKFRGDTGRMRRRLPIARARAILARAEAAHVPPMILRELSGYVGAYEHQRNLPREQRAPWFQPAGWRSRLMGAI